MINNVLIISGKQQRDQLYIINMYPFSPKLPSYPVCVTVNFKTTITY